MNEILQTQIDQVEPNLIQLKEEIDCYLAAIHYYTDREPKTLQWKIDAVKVINQTVGLFNTRIGQWTIQIINGTKTAETFPPEVIEAINDLDIYPPESENDKTPEDLKL